MSKEASFVDSIEVKPEAPSTDGSKARINTRRISPRLKSGVRFWRSDTTQQLHIGTRFSNFLLPDRIGSLDIESALKEIDHRHLSSEKNILRSQIAGIEILYSILEDLSLIDDEYTEIDYRYGSEESFDIASSIRRSVAQESFLNRMKIEANGISRSHVVRDGGVRKILERREFAIQINGSGRIAFALLGNLIASGFDLCEMANDLLISARDVIGGCVSKRDIGKSAALKLDELSVDASLYPEPREISKRPNLIISLGPPLPEQLEEWNREHIPQLFVDFESPGEIRIGPFVEAGNGACYNCMNIAEIERGWPTLTMLKSSLRQDSSEGENNESDFDLTAALTSFAAATLSFAVAEIADFGSSQFHQKTALFTTLNYLEPQITSWERSPRCSCNWI